VGSDLAGHNLVTLLICTGMAPGLWVGEGSAHSSKVQLLALLSVGLEHLCLRLLGLGTSAPLSHPPFRTSKLTRACSCAYNRDTRGKWKCVMTLKS
jgi:hypothetical protein